MRLWFVIRFVFVDTFYFIFIVLTRKIKNFPARYIHEPWNAPESIQKAAKCIIGREYSLPMVDHAVVSRTNMERLRQVYYQLYKYRDSSIYCSFFSVKLFFCARNMNYS